MVANGFRSLKSLFKHIVNEYVDAYYQEVQAQTVQGQGEYAKS